MTRFAWEPNHRRWWVLSLKNTYLRTEPPKVVSLKFARKPNHRRWWVQSLKYQPENRSTEGGESKLSKAYPSTKPPKVVSLKALNLRLKCEGMSHLVCCEFTFKNSFHPLTLMTLELRLQLESLTVSDRTRVFGESPLCGNSC